MATGNCQPAINDGSPLEEGFALFTLVAGQYVLVEANCPEGSEAPPPPPFDPKNPHPSLKCACVATTAPTARPAPPDPDSAKS